MNSKREGLLEMSFHEFGYVYIKSVNLSHNKVNSTSRIYCFPDTINEETNHGSDIIYCSFLKIKLRIQVCCLCFESGKA